MATIQYLQYLTECSSMEVRAVAENTNILLEMVSSESTTYCCKVDKSYDLVIKDSCGNMKYCVGGAEIVEHPITVYISPELPVGRIEEKRIYLTDLTYTSVIETNINGFKIADCMILVNSGLITISWPQDFPVEMKALTLSFAIQRSLTYERDYMIQNKLEVSRGTKLVDTDSSKHDMLQAECRENKPTVSSMFSHSDHEETFRLQRSGYQRCGKRYVLLDSSHYPRAVLFFLSYRKYVMRALDVFGAVAFDTSYNGSCSYQVLSDSVEIGEVFLSNDKITGTNNEHRTSTADDIQIKVLSKDNGFICTRSFTDSNGREIALFSNNIPTVLDVKFFQSATRNEKKLVLAYSLFFSLAVLKFYENLTKSIISEVVCSCVYCHPPREMVIDSYFKQLLRIQEALDIKAAGYNRQKNLVFYEVTNNKSQFVCFTLECTPLDKLKGMVKLEAKNRSGLLVFSAVQLPKDDTLVIYSQDNSMIGFHQGTHVFDREQNAVMESKAVPFNTERAVDERRFGPRIQHTFYDFSSGLWLGSITPSMHRVRLYRPLNKNSRRYSYLQFFMMLAMSVKCYCTLYEYDNDPIPEIVYRYVDETSGCRYLQ